MAPALATEKARLDVGVATLGECGGGAGGLLERFEVAGGTAQNVSAFEQGDEHGGEVPSLAGGEAGGDEAVSEGLNPGGEDSAGDLAQRVVAGFGTHGDGGDGAAAAGVIMMSQNRQDVKDRLRGELDYAVNRRAESEIQAMARKLNLLGEKLEDVEHLVRETLQFLAQQ